VFCRGGSSFAGPKRVFLRLRRRRRSSGGEEGEEEVGEEERQGNEAVPRRLCVCVCGARGEDIEAERTERDLCGSTTVLARSVRRHSRSGGSEESEQKRDKEKKSKETKLALAKNLAYVTHSDKESSVCWLRFHL